MRTESTSSIHPALAVVPPIVCEHHDDVASVSVLDDYRLDVTFHDGVRGIVDLSRLVQSPTAGVFAALRDYDVFAQAGVNLGAVTWPGDIDLAPDAMYAALRENGEWILC